MDRANLAYKMHFKCNLAPGEQDKMQPPASKRKPLNTFSAPRIQVTPILILCLRRVFQIMSKERQMEGVPRFRSGSIDSTNTLMNTVHKRLCHNNNLLVWMTKRSSAKGHKWPERPDVKCSILIFKQLLNTT
eukprot:scaffold295819_cov23-Tisochrysis_lutea.AAC.1